MRKIKALLTTALLAVAMPLTIGITGCNGGKDDPIVEDDKYFFTAKNGTGYEIRVTTPGVTLDGNGRAEVKSGTAISFILTLLDGYKESTPVVKANDVVLNKNADSTYSVTVTANTTITVTGVEKDTVYYDVTFEEGDGYSFNNININLTNYEASVAEGTLVSFKVNILEGYDGSNMLVKANSNVLNVNADGTYSFEVSADTTVLVTDVVIEAAKYNVTFTSGEGYSYVDLSETLVEGVATVAEGEVIYFGLQADEGYTLENAVVKANDDIIAADEEDGHYYVTIMGETTITVNGVAAQTFAVSLIDTDAYYFSDISGVSLTKGVGEAETGTEVSFKVNINSGYEKTDAFAVKVGSTTLVANSSGVYTFTVTGDSTVKVEGVLKGETKIANSILLKNGSASDDICTAKGYTSSTYYEGVWSASWASFLQLQEIELAKYVQLRFAVKCVNNKYFEFKCNDGRDEIFTTIAVNTNSWTEYFFVREDATPEGATKQQFVYRIYKNTTTVDGWSSATLSADSFLSDLRVLLGGDIGDEGQFVFSELRGRENPEYTAPTKKITFVEADNNHTLTIEGQTAAHAEGILGQTFTFNVVANEGYATTVSHNGVIIDPDENHNYTITVARENIVEIKDALKVSDIVLKGASFDPITGKSTLSSGGWGNHKSFVDIENINNYSSLYFSVLFSCGTSKGYVGIGDSSVKGGLWDFSLNTWYTITITKLDTNKFVANVSPLFPLFPTEGVEFNLNDGKLSDFGMAYTDKNAENATATFTQFFAKLA